jgi:hypothetical protein
MKSGLKMSKKEYVKTGTSFKTATKVIAATDSADETGAVAYHRF